MTAAYTIQPTALVLRDSPQNIDFHIRTGDYFLFLATMIGFIEEALTLCDEKQRGMARELRHDLRYVQANYRIEPRTLGDIEIIRPSGNLLRK